MKKAETIRILKMLDCYYRDTRKIDPEEMADAWHYIIGGYDYEEVRRAVVEFVKTDRREYPTFPVPSQIISGMETLEEREHRIINRIRFALTYGKDYGGIDEDAQRYISKANYTRIADSWTYMEMVDRSKELAELIQKLHWEATE